MAFGEVAIDVVRDGVGNVIDAGLEVGVDRVRVKEAGVWAVCI